VVNIPIFFAAKLALIRGSVLPFGESMKNIRKTRRTLSGEAIARHADRARIFRASLPTPGA
jgi:hypothetical protein